MSISRARSINNYNSTPTIQPKPGDQTKPEDKAKSADETKANDKAKAKPADQTKPEDKAKSVADKTNQETIVFNDVPSYNKNIGRLVGKIIFGQPFKKTIFKVGEETVTTQEGDSFKGEDGNSYTVDSITSGAVTLKRSKSNATLISANTSPEIDQSKELNNLIGQMFKEDQIRREIRKEKDNDTAETLKKDLLSRGINVDSVEMSQDQNKAHANLHEPVNIDGLPLDTSPSFYLDGSVANGSLTEDTVYHDIPIQAGKFFMLDQDGNITSACLAEETILSRADGSTEKLEAGTMAHFDEDGYLTGYQTSDSEYHN